MAIVNPPVKTPNTTTLHLAVDRDGNATIETREGLRIYGLRSIDLTRHMDDIQSAMINVILYERPNKTQESK